MQFTFGMLPLSMSDLFIVEEKSGNVLGKKLGNYLRDQGICPIQGVDQKGWQDN